MVSGGLEPVVSRFFKILFGEDLDKLMYLPPQFARTVKHLTNQETQIEDVSGRRWSVTLSCVNSSLAFQKGWPKFFLDHDLQVGQLLVFGYQGSHFTVQIFTRSACERTRFNNEMPRLAKKCRKDRVTSSEDEPAQTADVNSGEKTISGPLIPPGNEFQRRKTNLAVTNADVEVSQPLSKPVNVEDPISEINGDDGGYDERSKTNLAVTNADFEVSQPLSKPVNVEDPISVINGDDGWYEQRRNLLYDLSCFEKASNTKIPLSGIGNVEPTKPAGDDAMEQTKTTMKDAEMAEIETDVIMGDSGDISNDKFEKDLDADAALSHMENADQITKEVDDTPMAPHSGQAGSDSCDAFVNEKPSDNSNIEKGMLKENADQITKEVDGTPMAPHSGQAGSDSCDAFVNEKPSDNSNIEKGMLKNACNSQDGSGKIAEKEQAVKRKKVISNSSSEAEELPLGGHSIKRELVERISKDTLNPVSTGGKKQRPVVWNHAPMISPLVKVEPGTGLLDTISSFVNYPFSAEVKSKFYLELPVRIIASTRGKTRSLVKMVVFLSNSTGSIWPVLYSEYIGGRAFTTNWDIFCEQNNIHPGDRCRFTGKDNDSFCVYQVDIPPRRAVVTITAASPFGVEM